MKAIRDRALFVFLSLGMLLLLSALAWNVRLEIRRYDGCVLATQDKVYCAYAHPWGVH